MNPEQVRLLLAYDAWASRRTLDACAALSPEQFTRDLASSFPSVRDTAWPISSERSGFGCSVFKAARHRCF